MLDSLAAALQLKTAPNYTKVKVNAPAYKGSGDIQPTEERAQKQDQATQAYAKVAVLLQPVVRPAGITVVPVCAC